MTFQGYQLIAFSWSLFAFSTPFVSARLYVQLRLSPHPWRETFVVVAWLLYLGNTIIVSVLNGYNFYNHDIDMSEATDVEMETPLKVLFAQSFTYKPALYACKAALLCFYGDLCPGHVFPNIRRAIMIAWAFVVVGCAFQILYPLLQCWPFSLNFSWNYGAACESPLSLEATTWALHLFTDILVYTIPFFILRILTNISPKQKRAAYGMFAAGFFNIFSAVILLAWYLIPDGENLSELNDAAAFFTPIQMGSAVIIICLPQTRRLIMGMSTESMRPGLTGLQEVRRDVEGCIVVGKKEDILLNVEEWQTIAV